MFTLEVTLQDGTIDSVSLESGWAVCPKTSIGVHIYPGCVRVSNGTLPNPPGAIYFKSIKLKHDSKLFMVLPHFGGGGSGSGTLTLISDGQHLFRPRQIIERRFSLYNNASERGEAAKPLYYLDLQIPPVVENYGPTKSKMPQVNRDHYYGLYRGQSSQLMSAMGAGTPYYLEHMANIGRVGPYIFEGDKDGDAQGGYGIDSTLAGYEQCNTSVLFKSIIHEAIMARMFVAAYDRLTGLPVVGAPHDIISVGQRQWHQELDAFLEGPMYGKKYKFYNSGVCPYETELWSWNFVDSGHAPRAGRFGVNLVELANDPAAADDLWLMTEEWKFWIGDSIDRYWAWPIIFAVACQKYNRGSHTVWLSEQKIRVQAARDEYGICNHVNDPAGMPPGYLGCMTFHEGLAIIARFCLGDTTIVQTCESLYNKLSHVEYYGVIGPPHWTCTNPVFSGFGTGDPSHVYAALALAYRLTGNPAMLDIARKTWVPHTSNAEMLTWLQSLTGMSKAWGVEMEAVLGG